LRSAFRFLRFGLGDDLFELVGDGGEVGDRRRWGVSWAVSGVSSASW
jgi:hypothetical protein